MIGDIFQVTNKCEVVDSCTLWKYIVKYLTSLMWPVGESDKLQGADNKAFPFLLEKGSSMLSCSATGFHISTSKNRQICQTQNEEEDRG